MGATDLLLANDRPGTYPPSWYAETARPLPPQPALEGQSRADLCVIGAGYTGLSAALHAARAGLDVVLLEAQRIGFGASGRNGGQVGTGWRKDQRWLEARLGAADARRLWEMAEEAKALTRSLVARHAPEADYRPGVVHAEWHERAVPAAHALADHLATTYGYGQIEKLDRESIGRIVRTEAYAGGWLDRGAGHLHPLNYALGLGRACLSAGVRIHEGARVRAVRPAGGDNRAAAKLRVETDRGVALADQVILALNGYHGGLDGELSAQVMPINNFIIATVPLPPELAPLSLPVAVADSRFVVNYFRPTPDGRLLFGGGESYGYRFPRDIAAKVRRPMAEVFPHLRDVEITHAWGGTLAITRSRLPFVARLRPGVLAAGGYSGHGVALAGFTGKVLAEAALGQAGRFDVVSRLPVPPFPGRGALRAPLLALAMTWYALRDRLGL